MILPREGLNDERKWGVGTLEEIQAVTLPPWLHVGTWNLTEAAKHLHNPELVLTVRVA